MTRRKWDAKTKAIIVLEGLKGKPVAMSCQDYQISQAQYDQWRDQFLADRVGPGRAAPISAGEP
jgi:transposase-like protein